MKKPEDRQQPGRKGGTPETNGQHKSLYWPAGLYEQAMAFTQARKLKLSPWVMGLIGKAMAEGTNEEAPAAVGEGQKLYMLTQEQLDALIERAVAAGSGNRRTTNNGE